MCGYWAGRGILETDDLLAMHIMWNLGADGLQQQTPHHNAPFCKAQLIFFFLNMKMSLLYFNILTQEGIDLLCKMVPLSHSVENKNSFCLMMMAVVLPFRLTEHIH